MMSYRRPNNRGVPVGRVVASLPGRATRRARARARESATRSSSGRRRAASRSRSGAMEVGWSRAWPPRPPASASRSRSHEPVREGDRVFRVANAALLEAARRTYRGRTSARAVPVVFRVRLRVGEPAQVDGRRRRGHQRPRVGEIVEPARTKAGRSRRTSSSTSAGSAGPSTRPRDFSLELDAGRGCRLLDAARAAARGARGARTPQRLQPWSATGAARAPAGARRSTRRARARRRRARRRGSRSRGGRRRASRPVRTACCCLASSRWRRRRRAGADAAAAPRRAPGGVRGAARVRGRAPGGVGNLGMLAALGRAGLPVEADWGLDALNPWTVAVLADLGASLVWASPELSGRQIAALVSNVRASRSGVVGGRPARAHGRGALRAAGGGRVLARVRACARRRGTLGAARPQGLRVPRDDGRGRSARTSTTPCRSTCRARCPRSSSAGVVGRAARPAHGGPG